MSSYSETISFNSKLAVMISAFGRIRIVNRSLDFLAAIFAIFFNNMLIISFFPFRSKRVRSYDPFVAMRANNMNTFCALNNIRVLYPKESLLNYDFRWARIPKLRIMHGHDVDTDFWRESFNIELSMHEVIIRDYGLSLNSISASLASWWGFSPQFWAAHSDTKIWDAPGSKLAFTMIPLRWASY